MPALTHSVVSPKPAPSAAARQAKPETGATSLTWPPSLRSHDVRPGRDDLLGAVSAGRDDRVLVIGESAADTLCDAMRRGCRGGSAFRTAPAHPDPVEVVIAPAIRTEEAGQAIAACARRALPAGGRLALRAIGQGALDVARKVAARLRTYGFERVRLRGQAEGALVLCRLSGGSKTRKAR
ncbi:hypothetical protein [Roseomonas xinghualingensis]|uniref:hypothetical protein n=1 Tax=Roseomonas xinghualingensis TaxID=2986475 RepID=UPI0021F12CAA|nr:hypothetical protein [Roseomonas sp. SXEYE001]MCV4209186.1 hypothetical protein [Roseomonas sp. SXEYE001]